LNPAGQQHRTHLVFSGANNPFLISSPFFLPLNSRWANCSFGNTLLPPLAARSFYSVSNYYYTARFFRLGETVSVGEFADHAHKLCAMKWSDIISVVDVDGPDAVEEFCFRAFYLSVFLQNGLGFSSNGAPDVQYIFSSLCLKNVQILTNHFFSSSRVLQIMCHCTLLVR
jgi:hypothetical protein